MKYLSIKYFTPSLTLAGTIFNHAVHVIVFDLIAQTFLVVTALLFLSAKNVCVESIAAETSFLMNSSHVEVSLNMSYWSFGESASLWFRTRDAEGLLMYAGRNLTGGPNAEFLLLEIASGRPVFTADLGTGSWRHFVIRERKKAKFSSHGQQPEVSYFPSLHVFSPPHLYC